MTKIFKIRLTNKELKEFKKLGIDEWHFTTQEAAECTMNALSAMLAKGKKLNWECSVIEAMDKEDALAEFLKFGEMVAE